MVQVTIEEGTKTYIIRAFPTMYIDWGLEIMSYDGVSLFYSPSASTSVGESNQGKIIW